MKRTLLYIIALMLTIAVGAQTLNVQVGSVTYQFPASQTGEVGVASSSLVFRSMLAQVAELVDAHVSGACVERRAGSTPVLGTDSRGSVFKYRTSFYFTSHPSYCYPSKAGRKGKPRILLDEIP